SSIKSSVVPACEVGSPGRVQMSIGYAIGAEKSFHHVQGVRGIWYPAGEQQIIGTATCGFIKLGYVPGLFDLNAAAELTKLLDEQFGGGMRIGQMRTRHRYNIKRKRSRIETDFGRCKEFARPAQIVPNTIGIAPQRWWQHTVCSKCQRIGIGLSGQSLSINGQGKCHADRRLRK